LEVIEKEIVYESKDDIYTLTPLGDIHKGVVHCNENLLDTEVQKIHSNPLGLWVGMGDYGDLVVPRDFKRWDGAILAPWMKGHENNIGPTQLDNIDDTLSPIWDQCIVMGCPRIKIVPYTGEIILEKSRLTSVL